MKHRVKVTVLDTLLYEDLQQKYCQNPCSGKCPVYNKGDVFVFYREDGKDSFWQCGLNMDFFEINVEKFSNFRWFFSKPLAS